jgi:quercetin dioxygenase-like cupin family protein
MEIKPQQPTRKGAARSFSGDVWINSLVVGEEQSRVHAILVHFAPGARSVWHSHAAGQTLYITEGTGLIQTRGEPVVTVRAGDIIYTPADEEHWHGAAPENFMIHLAIYESAGDKPDAVLGDHVTDGEYTLGGISEMPA